MSIRADRLKRALERLLEIAKSPSAAEGEDVVSYIRMILKEDRDSKLSDNAYDEAIGICLSYGADLTIARSDAIKRSAALEVDVLNAKLDAQKVIRERIQAKKLEAVCDHVWNKRTLWGPKECERCGLAVAG